MSDRKGADDPLATARDLLRRGIMPLPVPCGKNPNRRKWQNYTITEANLTQYFNGADLNVGVRMGEKSGGLLDVDLDCEAALILWKHFLPETPARFGRHSKPESHHLYRCDPTDPKFHRRPTKSSLTASARTTRCSSSYASVVVARGHRASCPDRATSRASS
jgi:hypothetical protein